MRSSGTAVLAVVLLGALMRVWVPQSSAPEQAKSAAPSSANNRSNADKRTEKPLAAKRILGLYPVAMVEKIRDFYGREHSIEGNGQSLPCAVESLDHWCVPPEDRAKIRFILATVPDPVHSHLSLFFDRSIDAIVEGVGTKDYLLDRSIMPWHYSDDPNSGETEDQAKLRESFPGLMIFRSAMKPPLFVLTVGETPISGISKEQFHHALEIIGEIVPAIPGTSAPVPQDLGILGPIFSGSLYSLQITLNEDRKNSKAPVNLFAKPLPIYSTVMGTAAIQDFKKHVPPNVQMATFEEDATVILNALKKYAVDDLHYEEKDIVVLSEDETAYGQVPASDSGVLNLSFPRGIAQFRSEYSKELQSNSAQDQTGGEKSQQQRNLRLDLQVTGSDDDGIAPYAKSQMALSQESVMQGILSELRFREPKFILLRATDPLDELFLARYLRDKYPLSRLVVPTPDLLFPRDEAGQLNRVLGLNTYPLSPAKLNPRCGGEPGPVFPSSSSAALYNAVSTLVAGFDTDKPAEIRGAGTCAGRLSPDLWLTMVSGNSLRPVRVLKVDQSSEFFPSSGTGGADEMEQRVTRIPATWFFPYILCLVLMAFHVYFSWTGGTFGDSLTAMQLPFVPQKPLRRKAVILWLGTVTLVTMFVVVVSANTPARQQVPEREVLLTRLFWAPLLMFVVFTVFEFVIIRKERLLGVTFIGATAAVAAFAKSFSLSTQEHEVLWQQRTLDLTSGISPVTPIILLLVGLYCWFWYSFKAESLVDWRCPRLPGETLLPNRFYRLTNSAADAIRRRMRSFSGPWWLVGVVCVGGAALPALFTSRGRVPFRSLEGLTFDWFYCVLLGLAVVALSSTLFRIVTLWLEFRLMLGALDRIGFKDTLQRLTGLEWSVIWNPAWSVEKEGYKLIAREIQTVSRLSASLGEPCDRKSGELRSLRTHIQNIQRLSDDLIEKGQKARKARMSRLSVTRLLIAPFTEILDEFAATAGLLCTSFLDISWQNRPAENDSKSETPEADACGLSQKSLRLAEEFVGFVYSNFLVTVLQRIRGLVFCVVAIYVCVVFSTISYPFEPAAKLSNLAIALFVFSGLVIGYVYEEMHRDATLMRMTSTDPGKVDTAFWVKFASAGVAPLVALISTVYPPFGHLLYTLAGPLLQALR